MAEVTEQEVLDLLAQGKTPAAVGEELGISAQKVGSIRKASEKNSFAEAEVVGTISVRTAEEYAKYSKANGRTAYGGEIGVKYDCSIEDLRAKINSGWKPSMIMEKYQIDKDELKQLVWALSKRELRERPVSFNLEHDSFRN